LIDRTIRLPYCNVYRKDGKVYGYYRRDGRRQRIAGQPGSAEFATDYARIHAQHEAPARVTDPRDRAGTFGWLVDSYFRSPRYLEKAKATQAFYRRYMDELRAKYGDRPAATMDRPFVIALRDRWQPSPRRANAYVQILSILCEHAIDLGLRTDNPAKGVPRLKGKGGWRAWDAEELAWFDGLAAGAVRLAWLLALYTGQRESDVLAMTWSAIKDDAIEVTQEKTGARVWVPLHPVLKAELDAVRSARRGPCIVATQAGGAYSMDGFRSIWHRARDAAGLAGCTFHGLRKNAAGALAEAGATDAEIMAITGHKTRGMVTLYTRYAQQRALAKSAMRKLTNGTI
jgi:integrase